MPGRVFVSRIFWILITSFLLGVFVRSFIAIPFTFSLLLVVLAIAVVLLLWLRATERSAAICIATALLSGACGIERMNAAALPGDPLFSAQVDNHIAIEGRVVAEPDVREGSVRLTVAADTLIDASATSSAEAGFLVVVPAHTDVAYGDRIRAAGILRAPEAFDTGEGRAFAYPEYLAMQGIAYELSNATLEARERHLGNPLSAFAIKLKQTFLRGLAAALPEPAAGLAGGITVGDKRSIGEELSADFQTVGLIHMIVLSGYNITIVLNAAAKLIAQSTFLQSIRFVSIGVSGAIVVLFVLMSGGASSAARAGLMALIAVYARTSGRVFLASRALAVAALSIVIWNPFVLAFDPGFQLSFLATLGLIAFTPLFEAKLQWVPKKWALREIAASTLGTQLTVLPLLLYQNGQLPIYALPANLLTLVFMPSVMFLTLVAGIAGVLFGALAVIIGFPAYLLLQYIVSMAQIIASLPYASVSIGVFSAMWMFGSYAVMFLAATLWYKKRAAEPALGRPPR